MNDYISRLFESMKVKSEAEKHVEEVKTKVIKPSKKTEVQEVKMEDAKADATAELLENIRQFKIEFEEKILKPASELIPVTQIKDDEDPSNSSASAAYNVLEALDELKAHLEVQVNDPFISEEPPVEEANEDSMIDPINEEPEQDLELPSTEEPTIIDEWEFLASDPEFNGNATLLYDKNKFVVFIQKDSDKENLQPYYASTLDAQQVSQEHETADLDSLCKWLEVNELPVPTEEAKLALKGFSSEAKEEKVKLPDGMKLAKDNEEISTLAPKVPEPEVAKIEEPEKIKKK